MNTGSLGWSIARPWVTVRWRLALLQWGVPTLLLAALVWTPLLLAGVAIIAAATYWMIRDRNAIVLVLAALMINVKANYYTGSLTIFPEFPFLLLVGMIALLQVLAGEPLAPLGELWLLFGWWLVAGALSSVNALEIGRVASKGLLIVLAALIVYLILRGVRTRGDLRRSLLWIEGSALVSGVYSIVQVAGGALGWDTSLHFLEKYSNPDIYLGIGAPVLYQLSRVFRANGFFNDPNIEGGYLAAAISLVFALRTAHVSLPGRRRRAVFETVLLLALAVALLLTLSRSGFLATACGLTCVLFFRPDVLQRPAFWITGAVGIGVAIIGSLLSGIDPFLLVVRLGQTFDRTDVSSQQHYEVGLYALKLLARFPITGAGLRNYGFYYSGEVDAEFPNMSAHNAPLDFLAETGLFGGIAFLALVFTVLREPWKELRRDGDLRRRDPEGHAFLVGLFASMVALNVANLFYDYYLRTFVWVFTGLTLAAVRLRSTEASGPRT